MKTKNHRDAIETKDIAGKLKTMTMPEHGP